MTSRWITDKIYLHLYKNNNFFPKYFNNTDFEILFLILWYFIIFLIQYWRKINQKKIKTLNISKSSVQNKSKEDKDPEYQQVFSTEPFYIDMRLNDKSRTTFMGLK